MKRTFINARIAWECVRRRGVRSVLSGLGVLIGTLAVVLLGSIAVGVQSDITDQVQSIGANVLVVVPGRITSGTFNPNLGGQSFLEEQDAKALAKDPGVLRTSLFTFAGGYIQRNGKTFTPFLIGTTPDWFVMHPLKLTEGRVFNEADSGQDICVMGSVAKTALFGEESAIGKKVKINGRDVTVVGVQQDAKSEQSLFSMFSLQNVVYLSYHRLKETAKDVQTDRILLQIRPDAEPKMLLKRLDAILSKRLDTEQFQVLTQEDLLGLVYRVMGILTWLVTGLTSIAVLVGGVGIMTTMLMAVGERTREIGIRKTVGATRQDIFWQFIVESAVLGVIGSVLGLLLAYGLGVLIKSATPIKPLITWPIASLGLGMSLLASLGFGLLPAQRASKLSPLNAMQRDT